MDRHIGSMPKYTELDLLDLQDAACTDSLMFTADAKRYNVVQGSLIKDDQFLQDGESVSCDLLQEELSKARLQKPARAAQAKPLPAMLLQMMHEEAMRSKVTFSRSIMETLTELEAAANRDTKTKHVVLNVVEQEKDMGTSPINLEEHHREFETLSSNEVHEVKLHEDCESTSSVELELTLDVCSHSASSFSHQPLDSSEPDDTQSDNSSNVVKSPHLAKDDSCASCGEYDLATESIAEGVLSDECSSAESLCSSDSEPQALLNEGGFNSYTVMQLHIAKGIPADLQGMAMEKASASLISSSTEDDNSEKGNGRCMMLPTLEAFLSTPDTAISATTKSAIFGKVDDKSSAQSIESRSPTSFEAASSLIHDSMAGRNLRTIQNSSDPFAGSTDEIYPFEHNSNWGDRPQKHVAWSQTAPELPLLSRRSSSEWESNIKDPEKERSWTQEKKEIALEADFVHRWLSAVEDESWVELPDQIDAPSMKRSWSLPPPLENVMERRFEEASGPLYIKMMARFEAGLSFLPSSRRARDHSACRSDGTPLGGAALRALHERRKIKKLADFSSRQSASSLDDLN